MNETAFDRDADGLPVYPPHEYFSPKHDIRKVIGDRDYVNSFLR